MKKIIFLFLCGISFYVQAKDIPSGSKVHRQETDKWRQEWNNLEKIPLEYASFKKNLENKTGLSYTLDASFLPQRVSPNGNKTAWQTQYYSTVNWNAFNSETWGSGSLQAAYTAVRYWGTSANDLAYRLGLITPFNDYDANANYFDQFSYTHTFSGKMNILSLTIGQFPMYLFDGGDYDANQQINFLNESLSQNATANYPSASLGAYTTLSPNDEWSFSLGLQNANNISGETISWHKFKKGKMTEFLSASWMPHFFDLAGQYSVLFYYQPATEEQNTTSRGWSFNLQQNISNNIALFARINGAGQSSEFAKQSYAFGGVWNNPFQRNELDQLGLAIAFNKMNKNDESSPSRTWENILEGYYAIGISNFLTLTPDFQFYLNPANNTHRHTGFVSSLRATLMF